MKIMEQKVFKNLIHDLVCTPHQTFREIRTYDNIRVIGLQRVDNKQYYNICLLDEQGNDIDAKITYIVIDKFVSFQQCKKESESTRSQLPTMRVYVHYEEETIEFKHVKTVYIQEKYLMIIFEDDFKTIDLKDCRTYTILDK